MSEYQYYEFRAVDRPLNNRQMQELRAISTRTAISRTSFSNHYEYGDLKANPRDLLVKYFDASLSFANWLFLEVAFRYPKDAVDARALRRYAAGHAVEAGRQPASPVVRLPGFRWTQLLFLGGSSLVQLQFRPLTLPPLEGGSRSRHCVVPCLSV
jgi:hypothetical protein